MKSERPTFDAAVIAAVGMVLGITYLYTAMLSLVSNGHAEVLLLAESVPVTAVTGITLLLTGGFLAIGNRYSRYVGLVAFGAVVVFGHPSLGAPEPVPVIQAGFAALLTLYLLFKNPVPRPERSSLDETSSATRLGSTIR